MLKETLKLIGCIALCMALGVLGSVFTDAGTSQWYASLQKPTYTPPGWVFGPAWTVLYVLMGVALYLVLQARQRRRIKRQAVLLFVVQLILNGAWSFIFFGQHWLLVSLAEIVALWLAIFATVIWFWRVRRIAGYLLLPYLAWVGFAAFLNASIVLLNR